MANYTLNSTEREIISTSPSWFILLIHILLTFLTAGFWAPILLYFVLIMMTTRYVVTSQRVILEQGILSKSTKESPLDKVNNVSHYQSLLGRIFNYGNVGLQTASEMGATVFKFVASPKELKSEITNQVDAYKNLHMQQQARTMASAMQNEKQSQTSENTKTCPECAEDVKKEARVCRFCKFSFAEV